MLKYCQMLILELLVSMEGGDSCPMTPPGSPIAQHSPIAQKKPSSPSISNRPQDTSFYITGSFIVLGVLVYNYNSIILHFDFFLVLISFLRCTFKKFQFSSFCKLKV